jgi:elongation factor P hydroxylase
MTINQIYGHLNPKEAEDLINSVKINCQNPSNLEEYILSKKDGFKFNVSASAVNGNLNREMFLNYDFHF